MPIFPVLPIRYEQVLTYPRVVTRENRIPKGSNIVEAEASSNVVQAKNPQI